MPSSSEMAKKLGQALTARFQPRRRISRAVITSLTTDGAGRVIGATASVDGLVSQRIYVDHGSNLQVGDVLEVMNRGGAAAPAWYALRRLSTTIPIPTLPYGTILPTPYGLELEAGTYLPVAGGGYMGYINAQWRRIDQVYGYVSYQFECRRNDVTEDDPLVRTIPGFGGLSALPVAVSDSDTAIPYGAMVADFTFTGYGVIRIENELIYYTNMTRSGGCPFAYPYTLDTSAIYLLDYVEDHFTDTDSTDLASHTPDYDRYAGGWYVIPTYSSNWDIQSNKASATPGGTWPYSAALIRSNASAWTNLRMTGTWTWPSSGWFGYIVDYDDASNFVYVVHDAGSGTFEIIERVSGVETTVWLGTNPGPAFAAGTDYQFEVVLVDKSIYIRVYDVDDNPLLYLEAPDELTNSVGSEIVGLWSNVAVTVDNFWFDDARWKKFHGDEWNNFAYYASGQTLRSITDSGYSATNHRYEITLSGAPGATGGAIYPTFYGCTRGHAGTTAAAHSADAGIYGQTVGTSIKGLDANIDYNVRVRAYKTEDVFSLWTDWHTVSTAYDTTPPSDPTGFQAKGGVGQINFSWTGPLLETTPDLRGFEIYSASDSSGTGAALYATTGPVTTFYKLEEPGSWYYFNIKAVDNAENKSDYGEATWVLAASGYNSGGQLLSNADFEVGTTGPLHWQLWAAPGSYPTLTYESSGGVGNGRCFKAVLATSVPSPSVIDRTWPTLTESIDVPGVEDALYRISAYIKPYAGLTMQEIIDNSYFYFQLAASNGGNFTSITQPKVDEDYQYLGDGWYRFWQDRLWLNSSPSTYPYLALAMVWYQAAGSHDAGEFIVDRPQLELGTNLTEWSPITGWVGGDTGLRLDLSGILSDSIIVTADGEMDSDLVPAQHNTHDLGVASTNEWKDAHIAGDVNVGDQLTADRVEIGSPVYSPASTELSVKGDIAAEADLLLGGNIMESGVVDMRTAVSMLSLLPGIRALYPMSAVGAGNGNILDWTPHGNTLTYNGNPMYNFGGLVPYIRFDGTGDYGSLADNVAMSITATESFMTTPGFTAGCWIRPENATSGQGLIAKWGSSGNYGYSLFLWGHMTGDPVGLAISDDGTNYDTVDSETDADFGYTTNVWQFVVGRYNNADVGDELAVFLNENKATAATSRNSIYDNTAPFTVGSDGSNLYTGRMTLAFVCCAPLSDTVINYIFNSTRSLFGV